MFEKLLAYCEEQEKAYTERENEFPCMLYAGYANAYREIWNIVANMESKHGNVYRQYERIKAAVYDLHLSSEKYELFIKQIADILEI